MSRQKIKDLFRYIQEYSNLKSEPILDINKQKWNLVLSDLPNYPLIKIYDRSQNAIDANTTERTVLSIKKGKETACPAPPLCLNSWIPSGWEQLTDEEVSFVESRNFEIVKGTVKTEKFIDDPERMQAFKKWIEARNKWKQAEIPVRESNSFYEKLFSLDGELKREAEKFQLFFSDAFLLSKKGTEQVSHPVLALKVVLMLMAKYCLFVLWFKY